MGRDDEETQELLTKGEYDVLLTICPDGTPYGVPMSHAVMDNAIYMHCSSAGGQRLTNFECMTTRRSVRQFTDQPVTKEELEQVVSLAAYAPS